jgi:hypothetical protein
MDINEEQTEFYSLLGQCITQWSHVEDALFANFLIAISQKWESNMPAQAAFYAIQSPEGKISMANSAISFRLLKGMGERRDDPRRRFFSLWLKLCKRANQRRNRRNRLAHSQVLITDANKPGKRLELRAPLFNPNVLLASKRVWHCAELEGTRRSFGKLSFDLRAFSEGLAKLLGQRDERASRADRLAEMFQQLGEQIYEGSGFQA